GRPETVRDTVKEYRVNGTRICVLGGCRLIKLAAAQGHPASVMDMGFANQALAAEVLASQATSMSRDVHRVPEAVGREIARLKLASMGIEIDRLTPEQERYLASWNMGT